MEQIVAGLVLICILIVFLGGGFWVAFSLFGVALAGFWIFTEAAAGPILAVSVWGASNSWALAALPLFIWMGEVLFRSRLSNDLFSGLAPWLGRLPGGLLHTNILGCGIFAAVSGSSAATCVTVGKMSLPELKKRGYDTKMAIGTLAGSGTLGLLIPPSIILIVYGVATEQSISRLFIAGVLPGIMLITLFMGYVSIWSILNSDRSPPKMEKMPLKEKLRQTGSLIPVVLLIVGVIGSIYSGLASPTDAAALGVFLALMLTWYNGELNWSLFKESLMGATATSCMIGLIIAGAHFLTVAMGFTGIPRALAEWIGGMGLSTYALLAAFTLFFMVMGCFLDGISVVVLTTAVIVPVVEKVGIDPIWFGIFLVLVVEMAQITPPVGFNLFVLQGMTGENILKVAWYTLPFFLLLLVGVVLLIIFPELATYLPEKMNER